MQFVALLVIIISLVAIAYRDLKMGLLSLAGVALAALAFYLFSGDELKDLNGDDLSGQVQLVDTRISLGYADGFVLNARIENNHDSRTLQNMVIRSTLSDCNDDATKCLVIGEEDSVVKLRIPPGQARDTVVNLRIKQLNPIRGIAVWKHSIIAAR